MTQTQKIRLDEFNKLYNVIDLFPFHKLKGFWSKIKIMFFTPLIPIYKSVAKIVELVSYSREDKFIRGLKPL